MMLTLGSASPRRSRLLASLGVTFVVETVDIAEAMLIDGADQNPDVNSARIANAKFGSFPERGDASLLLTADTLVACDNVVMGKPDTVEQLATMLGYMSAKRLTIATSICYGPRGSSPMSTTVTTTVKLRTIEPSEIVSYVETGIGMDKAGGLALQAEAGRFIETVAGCWSNVLGLPLCAVSEALGLAAAGRTNSRICSPDLCGHHARGET